MIELITIIKSKDTYQTKISNLLNLKEVSQKTRVIFALYCAEQSFKFINAEKYPELYNKTSKVLELVGNWILGKKVSKKDLDAAAYAAYAAANAAYAAAYAAAGATYASANAAYSAANAAAYAANVAYSAAYAATYAANVAYSAANAATYAANAAYSAAYAAAGATYASAYSATYAANAATYAANAAANAAYAAANAANVAAKEQELKKYYNHLINLVIKELNLSNTFKILYAAV